MDSYRIEKPAPFYDQLYRSIKQMIVDGIFKPGERIVESRLARDFNVSRSPIREAIRALEKDGLIQVDDKSRIIVYTPTLQDVEDIYQCRMALESMAASLTVRRASDVELQRIEETLRQTRIRIEAEGGYVKEEVIGLNTRFHSLLIEFSGNWRLERQLNDLKALLHLYRVINFQGPNREWDIYNEHLDIFNAIQNRQEQQAADAMIRHLIHDYEHLRGLLGSS
ncbi:GntR family transcriptional regulator [Paenibacillus piri]|uniref:GntR family transcriptional regulator n=1 Tax=Paenibacillus piri TaxID=2547395 RepID=A0A4R5KER1_9BACL|nr:GntR family transcriptional regulator [Paenibacillus piri]TDF93165.1 GntR family transcriptional regulator [Paenibacillus piri]